MFTNNFSTGFNNGLGNNGFVNDPLGSTHVRFGLGGITRLDNSFTGLIFNNGILSNQFVITIGHPDSFGRLRDNLDRD